MIKIKMSFSKISVAIICFVFMIGFLQINGYAEGAPQVSAQSAVVIDQKSGRVLFNKGADWELPMASTTKIMTAFLALKYGNLEDIVEVSNNAAGVEGSSMYLEKGEKITLENLVYGLMLVSGNDAAVAIAENVGGSVEGFIEKMNQETVNLGLSHTHFDNPNGLPSETHYTTALELAKITKAAMDIPKFCEIVSTKSKKIPWETRDYDRELTNHNKLLKNLDGCIGVKTGFTKAAGRCLVSAVTRDEMTLICVTLNAPNDWNDHTVLHNSLFENYRQTNLTSTDSIIDKVVSSGSLKGDAGVSPDKTYTFPVCDSDDYKVDTNIDSDLAFPVKSGDRVGTGTITVNGEKYGEFGLIANNDIELNDLKSDGLWGFIRNGFSSLWTMIANA